ncbi:MAG: polysaccharide biosynthesis tyrosine autokinase [Ardenticatenaceae bacterium]|nr:polysaccharide biosynthesis tyrosine autokinase [Ardenticatenaceae bacterium]
MELRQYGLLIWKWLWLILLSVLVVGSATYFYNQAQPPIYEASTILLVNEGSDNLTDINALRASEQLALSFVVRLENYEVLTQALDNLGLDMSPAVLKDDLTVSLLDNTQLIALRVTHSDPEVARDLANEIPKVFADRNMAQQLERFAISKASLEENLAEIRTELVAAETILDAEMEKFAPDQRVVEQANNNVIRLSETYATLLQSYEDIRLSEARSLNNIIIDEAARLPQVPIAPKVITNTLMASVVAMIAATSLVFLISYLDDTLKNPVDVEELVGLSVLGVIKRMRVKKPFDALVVALEPRSPAAEAYRQLRTNIQFAGVHHQLKTILVTSPNAGDGKSTIASNLAVALAQSGKRVVLVDADMRRPTLHDILEIDASKGLSDLIARGQDDGRFIKATLIHNLMFLPAGRIPPNPAELIGSERMRRVIAWLGKQADIVIFDSPPLLAVTDAAILSKLVDATLLVISANETRQPALLEAVKKLYALESHIAGVLINKVNPKRSNGYYYYYRPKDNYVPFSENGHKHTRKQQTY